MKLARKASSEQRRKMLLSYYARFTEWCGRPVEEIELREFQKSELEISYRFVTRQNTDQHLVETIRKILGSSETSHEDAMVEKLAALHGVTDYE